VQILFIPLPLIEFCVDFDFERMNFSLKFTTQRYYRVAVSVFFFILGFSFSSWTSRIPDIKNALHLSEAGLGAVLFALPIGQLTAMGLSGFLVSNYGSKRILSFALFLYPTTLLGLGAVTAIWQLIAALFLFGMFANLCGISINTQGVGVERLYKRSIMASFHGVWSLAGFTGGLLSTFMVGYEVSPFVHFCIVYGIVITLFLTMRNYAMPRDISSASKKKEKRSFVKPDKYILSLGMIAFGSMICEGTMFDWSGVYFEKVINPPKELIRLGYIAFMFAMASGRFTADKLVTRFGTSRILQFSGIIITSGLLISVIFPNLIAATAGFLLVGIGTSSVVPLCYSLAGKSKIMHPSVAIATVSSIGFSGFLIGPPIIGFVAELSSLQWSFALIAFLGLATSLMATRIKPINE